MLAAEARVARHLVEDDGLLGVEEKHRRRGRREDRPRRLDDRLHERTAGVEGAHAAGRSCCAGHVRPRQREHPLHLERRQGRMLAAGSARRALRRAGLRSCSRSRGRRRREMLEACSDRRRLANVLAHEHRNTCKNLLSMRSRKPLSVVRRIEGSNPSPSAQVRNAHSYAVASHCSSSLQTTVVANLGDDREDDWCQAGERARRPLDRRSENRMVAWRGRTRFPRRFFDRWTRSRPLAVLTSRRSPVLGTLPVAHYRALRASAVARKAPRACPRSRPRSARSHERLLGSGRPSGRSLRG